MANDFEDGLPPSLMGTFIARLHRTLGAERTDVEFARSNEVMLRVGVRERMMVVFMEERRRVLWRMRGEDVMEMGIGCIGTLKKYLEETLHMR